MTNKHICDYDSVTAADDEYQTYYEELHDESLDGDSVRLISLICFRGDGLRYDAYEIEYSGVRFSAYHEPNSDRVLYAPSHAIVSDSRKMQRCRDKILGFRKMLDRKPHKSTAWYVSGPNGPSIMSAFTK